MASGKAQPRLCLAIVCLLMLVGHAAGKWWLVLPMFDNPPPFWLDIAAVVALGALMLLLFSIALRSGPIRLHETRDVEGPSWLNPRHG